MTRKDLEQEFTLAMSAFHSAQWLPAEQAFKRITLHWPDCKEAWFQLGAIYQRQGAWQSAVEMFAQVLELDPTIQEAYFNLGMMSFNQGNLELAVAYWQKSLEINPDYFEAGYSLALLYAQSAQASAALALLQGFLHKKPEWSSFLFSALQEQIQRGQTLEAHVLCQALESQYPGSQNQLFGLELKLLRLQIELIHENPEGLNTCVETFDSEDKQWIERLYVHKEIPEQIAKLSKDTLDKFPRDPAWYREMNPDQVNAWLLNAAQWPVQKCLWKSSKKRKKIILVMDAQALLWQEWYRLHLLALPAQWEIQVFLRYPFLQGMLQQETVSSVDRIEILPSVLSEAVTCLLAGQAEIILFSNPELDPLQFWLGQTRLAPLQLGWSATFPQHDFSSKNTTVLDGALPLWPLSSVAQTAETKPVGTRVAVGPMGLSTAEISALKELDHPQLSLLCSMLDLSKVRALSDELSLPVQVWRHLNELDQILAQSETLILPQHRAAELYAGAAQRHAHLALFSQAVDPGLFSVQKLNSDLSSSGAETSKKAWNHWWNALPATGWAVHLQDWFQHQSRECLTLGDYHES